MRHTGRTRSSTTVRGGAGSRAAGPGPAVRCRPDRYGWFSCWRRRHAAGSGQLKARPGQYTAGRPAARRESKFAVLISRGLTASLDVERPGPCAPLPNPAFGAARRANTAAQCLHFFSKFSELAKHIGRRVRILAPHAWDSARLDCPAVSAAMSLAPGDASERASRPRLQPSAPHNSKTDLAGGRRFRAPN